MTGLQVSLSLGARKVALAVEIPHGQTAALLGENGVGKSTVLACIAGLLRPDSGQISIDDRIVFDSARGVDIAPHRRSVGLLAQQPLLFPHLTVLDNVRFAARGTRADSRRTAMAWLDRVGAQEFAARRPSELSGGQGQRVALARALAAQPDVLLLDEPLAALDVGAAAELRPILRDVLKEHTRTSIVVTHDVVDAVAMSDTAVIMEPDGSVQHAEMRTLLAAPQTPFGAKLAGVNVVRGIFDGDALTAPSARLAGLPTEGLKAGNDAVARFSASAVVVSPKQPSGSARNVLRGRITDLAWLPHCVRLRARCGALTISADVTADSVAALGLTAGDEVYLAVKAVEVTLHSAS